MFGVSTQRTKGKSLYTFEGPASLICLWRFPGSFSPYSLPSEPIFTPKSVILDPPRHLQDQFWRAKQKRTGVFDSLHLCIDDVGSFLRHQNKVEVECRFGRFVVSILGIYEEIFPPSSLPMTDILSAVKWPNTLSCEVSGEWSGRKVGYYCHKSL